MNIKNQIDLREYWQILWRRKWYIFISFLIASAATAFLIMTATPVYEASTLVKVGKPDFASAQVRRMLVGASERRWRDTIERQIMSTEYLKKLIHVLDIRATSMQKKKADELLLLNPDLTKEEIIELLQLKMLRKCVRVVSKGAEFIEIGAEMMDPELVHRVPNTLAEIFIEESLKHEIIGAKGAYDFSTEQLKVFKKKMEDSQDRLRNFKAQTLLDRPAVKVSSDSLAEIEVSLMSLESKIKDKQGELKNMDSNLGDKIKYTTVYFPNELNAKISHIKAKISKLPGLMVRLSWRAPEVVRLNEQIDKAKHEVEGEITQQVRNKLRSINKNVIDNVIRREFVKLDIEYLQSEREALSWIFKQNKEHLASAPARELEQARLERDVAVNTELYNVFLSQTQGSEIQEALEKSQARFKYRILEPAVRPLTPIKSGNIKYIVFGFIFWFGMAAAIITVLEYLDRSFKNVEDVENFLNVPVLGTIPKIKSKVKGSNGKFWSKQRV